MLSYFIRLQNEHVADISVSFFKKICASIFYIDLLIGLRARVNWPLNTNACKHFVSIHSFFFRFVCTFLHLEAHYLSIFSASFTFLHVAFAWLHIFVSGSCNLFWIRLNNKKNPNIFINQDKFFWQDPQIDLKPSNIIPDRKWKYHLISESHSFPNIARVIILTAHRCGVVLVSIIKDRATDVD